MADLVKRYPKSSVNAVDGVSFSVSAGEVFGLLGPNGAGKTTTIGVLTTRVRPSSGTAAVGGIDVVADPVHARGQVAVVPQRSNLDRSLSIRDNLIFHAAYHGVPPRERGRRADRLLDEFGLLDRAKTKPDFFSGGQSQRVMIARALMHAPRVLFLDEPTTGLDPAARLFVWDRLRELQRRGVTLVLTTHDMDEAAALADRVGIMDHGKLLALDRPVRLIRSLRGSATLELSIRAEDAVAACELTEALGRLPGVERGELLDLAADGSPELRVVNDAEATVAAPASQGSALLAVMWRDIYVTWTQLPAFLAQVILQPLFLLFVFGKVLGSLGYTHNGYANVLFPGLLALTAVITGMQSLAFPLVAEFGWTKEIEDRLLAPLSTALVAAEKIAFAALRSIIATSIMVPVGILVLGSIPWRWSGAPLFVAILILGALLGAALGLVIGTLVQPAQINIVFSLVFTPLLFTGASQYPWPSLSRLPWFQVVTAANPMTYVSEGLRGALIPQVPHIQPWICLVALSAWLVGLMAIGVRGFYRRAID